MSLVQTEFDRERALVYVVDDDALVCGSITRLVRASGLKWVAFENAKFYLASAPEPCEAVCLVLDIRMPELSGIELQELLRGTEREAPIIFVTGYGDIPTCVKALKSGAVSFLAKPFEDNELLAAIAEALKQSFEWKRCRALDAEFLARFQRLSRRERDVFSGVVSGLLNKQIAAELGIAEKTVKVHRGRVMTKMEVDSVASLVRLAERLGVGKESTGYERSDNGRTVERVGQTSPV